MNSGENAMCAICDEENCGACELCHDSGEVEHAPDSTTALRSSLAFAGATLLIPCWCPKGCGKRPRVI